MQLGCSISWLTCTPDTAQVDTKGMGPRLDAKAGMITKGGYKKYNPDNPGSTPVEGEVRKTAQFHDAARSPKNGSNHCNMAQLFSKDSQGFWRLKHVKTWTSTGSARASLIGLCHSTATFDFVIRQRVRLFTNVMITIFDPACKASNSF